MSNNLYEEAINAAEQIKEATESRVKQQLVEAMSPKIREMIEKSYMQDDSSVESEVKETYLEDNNIDEYGLNSEESLSDQTECGEGISEEENIEGETVEISAESVEILKNMLSERQKRNAVSEKLESIREGINHLKKAIILAESSNKTNKFKKKFIYAFKNLLQELKNIKSSSIIKTDKTLLKEYLQLSKELNNMSRRRSSRSRYLNENLEELLEMNLFEEEEEEGEEGEEKEAPEEMLVDDEEEMMDDAPEEDSDALMVPREVAEMSLEELIGAVEGSMSSEDEDLEEGIVYEFDEMEAPKEGENCGPVDHAKGEQVEETYEAEEGVQETIDEDEALEGLGEGLFLEIDENMLKREISNMRRLREGEASDMASHFGGGDDEGEAFVDGVDLNALDEGSPVSALKLESALRKAIAENRKLKGDTKQYKNALQGMKQQLSEMNLFNAKLLYANKLMQNRDLTMKQQRHIVESLDEAGTLNEAKLLFESLSKSLSRPAKSSGSINESTTRRTLGSASRAVRSAQPMNEGVALDRWATLAGIKK